MTDGSVVSCRDKLAVLEENAAELRDVMQAMFEDAVLMGVDETQMREVLTNMVTALENPKR